MQTKDGGSFQRLGLGTADLNRANSSVLRDRGRATC